MQIGGALGSTCRRAAARQRARAAHPAWSPASRPASPRCSARRSAPRCSRSRCCTATTSSRTRSSRRCSPASSPTRWSSRSSARSTLFAHAAHFPFDPQAPAALRRCSRCAGRALARRASSASLAHGAARVGARCPVPLWARPALGGLALGIFCRAASSCCVGWRDRRSPARASGLLGGGYGAVQIAITGATWLPGGWARRRAAARSCAWPRSSRRRSPSAPAAAPATSPRRWSSAACSAARSAARRRCCSTIRASIPAPLRWSAWAPSTAASRTCRWRRWSWSASWRAATTCSCR